MNVVPREIRVELTAAVPVAAEGELTLENDVRATPLLQQALEAGIADAVRRTALELQDPPLPVAPQAAHAPLSPGADADALLAAARARLRTGAAPLVTPDASAAEADVLAALAGAPSDYALRYRVLEVLGQRPRTPDDAALAPGFAPNLDPAHTDEFALRLEVYVDGPRLADALADAGLRARRDPSATPALRVVLAPAPSWRALQSFRAAALARGATAVTPEFFAAREVVLRLLAPEPQRLLAALARRPPAGLHIQVHAREPARWLLELSLAPDGTPPPTAQPSSPDALRDALRSFSQPPRSPSAGPAD